MGVEIWELIVDTTSTQSRPVRGVGVEIIEETSFEELKGSRPVRDVGVEIPGDCYY